ncbi:MAG: ATP-binding protein [Firmicutes bacterium]|jgi:Fe-S cluster assembly ATPase SufC|nr:ATP-binding protein [Bacillota bacterium]
MGNFIRSLSVKGIKNICNQVDLIFCKNDVSKFEEARAFNVKAIYGPNGSGKTGIIHSFQILQNLVFKSNYLYDDKTTTYLNELINKQCDQIDISISFFYSNKRNLEGLYFYDTSISYINNEFEILSEKYSKRDYESSKDIIIFTSEKGISKHSKFSDYSMDQFKNLLNKRSFSNILYELLTKTKSSDIDLKDESRANDLKLVVPLLSLMGSMNIIIDKNDDHFAKIKNKIIESDDIIEIQNNWDTLSKLSQSGYNSEVLTKNELEKLKLILKRKLKFIRLFKPEIKSIETKEDMIKSSSSEELFAVNQLINYGDYMIDLEFESVGIKKLMELFSAIEHVSKGGILIIDELDSHINDVYLVKIINYISEYASGQLIFTTHNISPMETLKTKKLSIDFMSSSSIITTWTQLGNYSPSKLYQKGMIRGLPFNIEAEDFVEVFEQ